MSVPRLISTSPPVDKLYEVRTTQVVDLATDLAVRAKKKHATGVKSVYGLSQSSEDDAASRLAEALQVAATHKSVYDTKVCISTEHVQLPALPPRNGAYPGMYVALSYNGEPPETFYFATSKEVLEGTVSLEDISPAGDLGKLLLNRQKGDIFSLRRPYPQEGYHSIEVIEISDTPFA